MRILSGVTGACDQSVEGSQSDWSTKFYKLFWQVADKHLVYGINQIDFILPWDYTLMMNRSIKMLGLPKTRNPESGIRNPESGNIIIIKEKKNENLST